MRQLLVIRRGATSSNELMFKRVTAAAIPLLAVLAVLGTTGASPVAARTNPHTDTSRRGCSAAYFLDDRRLGPARLARTGAGGRELRGYRRTGGLSTSKFLDSFWNPDANSGKGGWRYPPASGYVTGPDGQPIEFRLTLAPGTDIDRYGSEYGRFLSPTGLPYAMRSIPPQNLDSTPPYRCNYHDYEVLKTFAVDAGPIAPWFAQPGYGLQYQLEGALIPGAPASINVLWLLGHGYLKALDR